MRSARSGLVWSGDPRVKPPYGAVEVDRGHPLAEGLEFCVLGPDQIDLVFRELGTMIAGSGLDPTRGVSTLGTAFAFHGNTSQAQVSGFKFTAGVKRTTWSGFGAATVLSLFIIDTLANIDQSIWCAGTGAAAGIATYAAATSGLLNINTPGNWGIVSTTLSVAEGVPYAFAFSWPTASGDTQVVLRNLGTGAVSTATLAGKYAMANGNAASYEIGSSTRTSMNGRMGAMMFSTRKMSLDELIVWTAQPYVVLRPIIRRRYFVPGGTNTGTAAITLDALTSAATGILSITGAAAPTLGALTTTAAGVLGITGQAGITLGGLTTTAAGELPIAGVAAITLEEIALGATGDLAITGEAAITLGALTVQGFDAPPTISAARGGASAHRFIRGRGRPH